LTAFSDDNIGGESCVTTVSTWGKMNLHKSMEL